MSVRRNLYLLLPCLASSLWLASCRKSGKVEDPSDSAGPERDDAPGEQHDDEPTGELVLATGGGVDSTYDFPFPRGESWTLTCGYGCNYHTGADYYSLDFASDCASTYGAEYYPIAAGVVIKTNTSGYGGGYGLYVDVDHGDGHATRSAHMSEVLVSVGDYVDSSTLIGRVGDSGNVAGSCASHPGAHIHVTFWTYGAAGDKPEPMSGCTPLTTLSSYSTTQCNPNDPIAVEVGDVSSRSGTTSDDFTFTWSGDGGDATTFEGSLFILNPHDGVIYDFGADDCSQSSAGWVCQYTKEGFSAAGSYVFWFGARDSVSEDYLRDASYVVEVEEGSSTRGANLAPGSVTVSDRTPEAGDRISVEGQIDNDGDASSGRFSAAIYWSSNSSFGASDSLLASWTEDSLSAGGSTAYDETVTVPSEAEGDGYILVVADPDNEIDEVDEDDNTSSKSISVGVGGSTDTVNLHPDSISVSESSPTAGDSLTVSGSISNDGSASSGSFTVGVYLSTNSTFSASDEELKTWTQSSVSAGSSGSYSKSVDLPDDTDGSLYLLVVSDPEDSVDEEDESDNTASTSLSIAHLNTAVDATVTGDWCAGSSRDIFMASSVSLASTTSDPEVTATFEKCDGSAFTSSKDCHVRVGSYSGTYDSSLVRVAFTWSSGSTSKTVSWNAWNSTSPFSSASAGDTKDFYLICEEPTGDWNHWRAENPIVIEVE